MAQAPGSINTTIPSILSNKLITTDALWNILSKMTTEIYNNIPQPDLSEKADKYNTLLTGYLRLGDSNDNPNPRTVAIGTNNQIYTLDSVAIGNQNKNQKDCSLTVGNGNKVTNSNSVGIGYFNCASGYNSFASGYNTIASGSSSHAEGQGSTRLSIGKLAVKSSSDKRIVQLTTMTSNYYSYIKPGHILINQSGKAYTVIECSETNEEIQLDRNFTSSDDTWDLVFGVAYGDWSHVEGQNSIASGVYSHAEGYETYAQNAGSHSEGLSSKATGEGAHAEGNTIASGAYSHAEGKQSQATGHYSHAEGYQTLASNKYAHAEGTNTQATALGAHVEGYNTIATGAYSHVIGAYNIEDSYDTWPGWQPNTLYKVGDKVKRTYSHSTIGYICNRENNDTAFDEKKWFVEPKQNWVEVVGNGTSPTRSNARTLDWDGNEWLAGNITVNGGSLTLHDQDGDVTITAAQLRSLLATLQ